MYMAEVYTDFDEAWQFDGLDSYETYISEQLASAMTQADKLRPHLNELHTVRSYYDRMMLAKPIVALLLDFETARVRFVCAGIAAGDDGMLVKNRELLKVY